MLGDDRELECDIAWAATPLRCVGGVYALEQGNAAEHPDVLRYAIVLRPYAMRGLVETHYLVRRAIGPRAIGNRILYVDAAARPPAVLQRARRIVLSPHERDEASRRAERRAARRDLETRLDELRELEEELRAILARDETLRSGPGSSDSPPPRAKYEPLDRYEARRLRMLIDGIAPSTYARK